MAKIKYKKLTDLYTRGVTHVFDGGSVMWIQVMNPFEVDEARKNAQASRVRIVNALRDGDQIELLNVEDSFRRLGKEAAVEEILATYWVKYMSNATLQLEVDEEWKEKVEVLKRSDKDQPGLPAEEVEYLVKLDAEYVVEIDKRMELEREQDRRELSQMSDEKLLETYRDLYLERRGTERAMAEYNVNLIYFGARDCEAQPDEEGNFPDGAHKNCDHRIKAFESIEEVRNLPQDLFIEILNAASNIEMTQRDARFSDRQQSSSESSPLPSAEEESTPSTPKDQRKSVLGL